MKLEIDLQRMTCNHLRLISTPLQMENSQDFPKVFVIYTKVLFLLPFRPYFWGNKNRKSPEKHKSIWVVSGISKLSLFTIIFVKKRTEKQDFTLTLRHESAHNAYFSCKFITQVIENHSLLCDLLPKVIWRNFDQSKQAQLRLNSCYCLLSLFVYNFCLSSCILEKTFIHSSS